MGWGAAYAFAAETGFSPDDAYEMLYGEDRPNPNRCPICNHKCRSADGVSRHMTFKHTKPKHAAKIAEWMATHNVTAPK